jgi:hypothetical protein
MSLREGVILDALLSPECISVVGIHVGEAIWIEELQSNYAQSRATTHKD